MVEALINKQRVANSFSRAAGTYDSVAELQRDIGTQLLTLLPQSSPQSMLDLGCGTGFFTPALKQNFSDATLFNLDLAFGMLQFARENRPAEKTHWLCADAEALPLATKSIDLVFSSLAIQWCENLPHLFSEIERILKPGGRFIFSTLGPQTLCELRIAWKEADSYVHVNEFMPDSDIRNAISDGLMLTHLEEELRILKYAQLKGLTDELKRLGAHNMNAGQQVGLTGRERLRRFKSAYEHQRLDDGTLPATYQVYYAVVEKPLGN
ncbi:malonyl-ACP O-methyltransferase BioC [Neptuniibacter sp.]|uniref:malonyl-ACP O-methyltransferase BioC n=1 Tax=Neptuniibacter sp. TaxID=1962643 RepID=UPI002622B896|nr:malonyl-ACP O-methyltransferase BioC [Neptuniibacter sp.]